MKTENVKFVCKLALAIILYLVIKFLSINYLELSSIRKNTILNFTFLTFIKDGLIAFITCLLSKRYLYIKYFSIDFKTKVYNNFRLHKDLKKRCKKKKSFLVCFIDMCCFKQINDTYGHDVGDSILVELCKRFKAIPFTHTYRFGGDEFVILLDKSFNSTLKSIYDVTYLPFKVVDKGEDLQLEINFSIGISNFPNDSTKPEELLKIADTQMYNHKHKN